MKTISLKLTVDDTNLVLEGLGLLPFAKVYALVTEIQCQARKQLETSGAMEPDQSGAVARDFSQLAAVPD